MRDVYALPNGMQVIMAPGRTCVVLPSGRTVHGVPYDTDVGYGQDTVAMCEEHDPLHAWLSSALGLPSHALRRDADERLTGEEHTLAALEEDVVMALHRYLRACGKPVAALLAKPVCCHTPMVHQGYFTWRCERCGREARR